MIPYMTINSRYSHIDYVSYFVYLRSAYDATIEYTMHI